MSRFGRGGRDRRSAEPKSWRERALVRLLLRHALVGFGLAAVAMALILGFDPGGVGRLLARTPLAIALLWFFMGLTFASVQMGMAVMELREGEQRAEAKQDDEIES